MRASDSTPAYAAARRAELFVLLDSLAHSRRRGFVPFERRLLPTTLDNIVRVRLRPPWYTAQGWPLFVDDQIGSDRRHACT